MPHRTGTIPAVTEVTDGNSWQVICANKRAARDSLIPKEWVLPESTVQAGTNLLHVPVTCGILSEDEIRITSDHDVISLSEALQEQKYTAEQVARAFCKRAAIAQQLTNCLTEIFFDEAIESAANLDKHRAANPTEPLAALWGIPISLKDSFNLVGKDSTLGLACFVDSPATEDAVLVTLLRSLGAILYCKTNVPQTMMTADSDNNVFGRTLNPANTSLTAGGSTGGEGALIALRGSILGVGTDIAGSLRIPSHSNGLYAFKPTSGVIPFSGQQAPAPPGVVGVDPVAGPMATSVRSCAYFMKAIVGSKPSRFDSHVHNVTWSGAAAPTKLLIGIVADDGQYTPSPPMRRALKEAEMRLRAAGHEVVAVSLPNVAKSMGLTYQMYGLDGGQFISSLIDSTLEPLVPSVQLTGLVSRPYRTLEDFFAMNVQREASYASFMDVWKTHGIDLILCLPAPHTAVPLDTWTVVTYTALFNLWDVPAAIVPVGKVDFQLDPKDESARFGDEDLALYRLYTGPEAYADAPLTVQLVGRRGEDEALLGMVSVIDAALSKST